MIGVIDAKVTDSGDSGRESQMDLSALRSSRALLTYRSVQSNHSSSNASNSDSK